MQRGIGTLGECVMPCGFSMPMHVTSKANESSIPNFEAIQ